MTYITTGRRGLTIVSATAVLLGLGLGASALVAVPAAADPLPITVSQVIANRYIEVDGVPFNPLAVQFRVDRAIWLTGLTFAQTQTYFADAKRQGFNTIAIPLPWSQFETSPGVFDYTWLNSFIDNAHSNGLKLELIWFGSKVGGGGASQFMPTYITNDSATYPDQVNSDGSRRLENHPYDGQVVAYSMGDTHLRDRETSAIQALMSHLATYDMSHTTIGIQLNNEPQSGIACNGDRSYDAATAAAYNASGYTSGATFANYQLAQYENALGAAVKNGPYRIYTRLNYSCQDDLQAMIKYAPMIDFHGNDPYSADSASVRNNVSPALKKLSISENGPYPSAVTTMLAAYDGGAVHYSTYQLLFEANDYDAANHIVMVGVDHADTTYAPATINAVTQLGKDTQLMQKENGVSLKYYYSDSNSQSYTVAKTLNSGAVNFSTANAGQGVAETDGNNVYLMGFGGGGTFTVGASQAPAGATDGHFDGTHNWVSGGSVSFTNNGDGTYSVPVSGSQFVRLNFSSILTGAVASASSSVGGSQGPAAAIDGSYSTALVSSNSPSFPQTVSVAQNAAQNVAGASVSCTYCQGQGVTNFDVQVSTDGSTNWTTVGSSGTIAYQSNSSAIETKTVSFGTQLQVKGVRVVINSANLQWSHYVVNALAPIVNGPSYRYQIVNLGNSTYINLQDGSGTVGATALGATDWWTGQWGVEYTDNGFVRFSNRQNSDYLHNQDNFATLEHGALGRSDWWSAQWKFIPTSGGYGELQNRQVPADVMYLQAGQNFVSQGVVTAPPSASAQWKLLPVR